VAVLIVRHLTKQAAGNPLYRGGGSIGIIGAARSGLLVGKAPDDEETRVLASLKCNLARRPPSLIYAIVAAPGGAPVVRWLGASPLMAEDLVRPEKVSLEERGALAEAKAYLRQALARGPVPADKVRIEALCLGIAERTLDRAKAALGVQSGKEGFGEPWAWRLPETGP
jgi:hypothetical protein